MKHPAWYLTGAENHEGELELRADALAFNVKKKTQGGVYLSVGPFKMNMSSAYEPMFAVPRNEIRGTYPSPNNPNEFAVYTTRGTMLVFSTADRNPWLQMLGPLPPGG
jgi:hypothetical protein